MDIDLGPLPSHRVRAASLLLTAAFADDGILTRYMPGRRGRRLGIPAFFASVIEEHLETTYAATLESHLVGVAVWAPPEPAPARLRARSRLLLVRALFPRASRSLLDGLGRLEQLHPSEPHWYLAFTGVDPARHGTGIGAALLQPVLAQADHDGLLCCLETPFPRTHAFYRRLGFELTSTVRPFEDARPLDIMIRKPRAADAQTE
jgi:GNAT superfamily N-acetyltransferase